MHQKCETNLSFQYFQLSAATVMQQILIDKTWMVDINRQKVYLLPGMKVFTSIISQTTWHGMLKFSVICPVSRHMAVKSLILVTKSQNI